MRRSVSSDDSDQQSERCGSYNISADVSESESSSSYFGRPHDNADDSYSMPSSPNSLRPIPGEFSFLPPPSFTFPVIGWKDAVDFDDIPEFQDPDVSELTMMKEKFAKLLLGEDMSGGGKGVCSALAISNSITNLSASAFRELRLEPLGSQKKAMWRREMDWLLCVSNSIVELVPSTHKFPGGGTYEVMATRPRSDIHINLPALRKLDAMLLSILDSFDSEEFSYVGNGISMGDADYGDGSTSFDNSVRHSIRQEEKWWLPSPKVPSSGLSEEARKRLQQCKESTQQILKASMAINSCVLAEMDIPIVYMESLPKNGKLCIGEVIYRHLTSENFSPEAILDRLNMSREHQSLEIANQVEAAVHIWRQKHEKKNTRTTRSSWGGKVKGLVADADKDQILAHRAETLLLCLKRRFPALPQTVLDMTKIQYNKDVGHAILESYSRVMESLAFNILERMDDLSFADEMAARRVAAGGADAMSPPRTATPYLTHTLSFSASPDAKAEKQRARAEPERTWLHSGNLISSKVNGDAPERD